MASNDNSTQHKCIDKQREEKTKIMDTIMHVERHNQLGNPLNELFANNKNKFSALSRHDMNGEKKNILRVPFCLSRETFDDDDPIEP